MSIRLAFATLLGLAALPASAACTGESYLDTLTDGERGEIIERAQTIAYGEGLRWKAEKGDARIDILGTIHIHDPRLPDLANAVASDINAADLMLVEATEADELALQQMLAENPDQLFITEGPTLVDLLEPAAWDTLSDTLLARQIPPFMAAKMQPWYLSMLLSIPECAASTLMQGDVGLDKMLLAMAGQSGVPVESVEHYTTVLDIFRQDPIEEQVEMMMVNLQTPQKQEQMFVATLDAYFAQDVAELWEMSRTAMQELPGMRAEKAQDIFAQSEEALLTKRNRNWIPVILDKVGTDGRVFLAVGAAHLIGNEGVLKLLEQDGWTLTRVQLSP